MVKIGQKVRFNPLEDVQLSGLVDRREIKEGIVKYINSKHRWFSVEYDGGAGLQRISFDYTDLGRKVHICK